MDETSSVHCGNTFFFDISSQCFPINFWCVLLSLEEFGYFSIYFSASQVLALILNCGAVGVLQKELPKAEKLNDKQFIIPMIVISYLRTVLLAIGLFSAYSLVSNISTLEFLQEYGEEVKAVVALSFAISMLQTTSAILRVYCEANLVMFLRDCIPYALFLVFLAVVYENSIGSEVLIWIFFTAFFLAFYWVFIML